MLKAYDITLWQFCKLLKIIDAKLCKINECISKSVDPKYEEFFGRGEYFIGIGFVAIQQHLSAVLIGTKLDKKEMHSSSISSI